MSVEAVARAEGIEREKLERLLRDGRVVIPRNARRDPPPVPVGIGEGLCIKVNANVGTSTEYVNVDEEVEKARTAEKYGAHTVMDLSIGGDIDEVRKRILSAVKVPVGTVPVYQAVVEKGIENATSDDFFRAVERHARDGVDFVTIHAGVNRNTVERLRKSNRILDVVSRGGCITISWMLAHGRENPFYEDFDHLLDIAKEYDLTLSLGDGMRSGCLADSSDRAKFTEFIVLGELVKRARECGVQAIVEGPGHVPLDQIEMNVRMMKSVTDNAPLYLLGPLVTDVASGYDHIAAAIGGAVAGAAGADFLCVVTPSEHLALPTPEDIKEGVLAARIAAHAADIIRLGNKARIWDDRMSVARRDLKWEDQFKLSMDEEKAREIWNKRASKTGACSMCSHFCAIKMMKRWKK